VIKESQAIGVHRHGDADSLLNGTVEVGAPELVEALNSHWTQNG
jgi:hypothetical protein